MNSLLQNKKDKKPAKEKLFFGFSIVIVLLFTVNFFTSGSISNVVRTPAASLWGIEGVFGNTLSTWNTALASKKALQQEMRILKERVRELELYSLNNLILVTENEELRKLLAGTSSHTNIGILAQVISRGGENPYGTIVVANSGSAPLAVGSLVFGASNVVIGSITESNKKSALVTLFSAAGEETQVLIGSGESVTQALLVGTGNGNMTTKIPRDVPIQINDPIILVTEGSALVGFIGDIETKPTDAFQHVRVRTPLNLETIRFTRVRQ